MSRGKICQCQKSRTTLFILSKRNDDLIVKQNVRFEFRQNQRHYCLYGCTALKNVTVITSTHNLLLSSIKSCSFFVVKNKQTRLRFLLLEKLPPEKPRDIAFNPISPYEVSILYASVHVCFALWRVGKVFTVTRC